MSRAHLSLSVTPEQREAVQAVCAAKRVSMSQLVRLLFDNLASGTWRGDDGRIWTDLETALSEIAEAEMAKEER